MNDIISINRQFLTMARDASKARSGELLTGLSRGVLDRLAQMSLEEIFSRVHEAKRVADLEALVGKLQRKRG